MNLRTSLLLPLSLSLLEEKCKQESMHTLSSLDIFNMVNAKLRHSVKGCVKVCLIQRNRQHSYATQK